jgi:hypothetical protein
MSDEKPIESTNSSAGDLTTKADAQLSEDQLKKVSGGLKFEFKKVFVTGIQQSGSSGETEPAK